MSESSLSPAGAPVQYMARTRQYYRALGYGDDYIWAHFDEVPFARPAAPSTALRTALVTTASPPDWDPERPSHEKRVWAGDTDTPPDGLCTARLSWDRDSTHTRDRETYLPIDAFKGLHAAGRAGPLARRFHAIPTRYSVRRSLTEDIPALHAQLREDGAEAALLFPL